LIFDSKVHFILNNYVRIRRTTITTTRYDFKTLKKNKLYSKYQKVHPSVKHPSNFGPQK